MASEEGKAIIAAALMALGVGLGAARPARAAPEQLDPAPPVCARECARDLDQGCGRYLQSGRYPPPPHPPARRPARSPARPAPPPPRTAPQRVACPELCCDPERRHLHLVPQRVSALDLIEAASLEGLSPLATRLGGMSLSVSCDGTPWTPTARPEETDNLCRVGPVELGGLEAQLSVLATRRASSPGELTAALVLEPRPTSGAGWSEAISQRFTPQARAAPSLAGDTTTFVFGPVTGELRGHAGPRLQLSGRSGRARATRTRVLPLSCELESPLLRLENVGHHHPSKLEVNAAGAWCADVEGMRGTLTKRELRRLRSLLARARFLQDRPQCGGGGGGGGGAVGVPTLHDLVRDRRGAIVQSMCLEPHPSVVKLARWLKEATIEACAPGQVSLRLERRPLGRGAEARDLELHEHGRVAMFRGAVSQLVCLNREQLAQIDRLVSAVGAASTEGIEPACVDDPEERWTVRLHQHVGAWVDRCGSTAPSPALLAALRALVRFASPLLDQLDPDGPRAGR